MKKKTLIFLMISIVCILFAACEQPSANVPEDPVTPPVEEPTDKGYVFYNYVPNTLLGTFGGQDYQIKLDNYSSNGLGVSTDSDFSTFRSNTKCGEQRINGRLVFSGQYPRYPMDDEHEQIIPYTVEYEYSLGIVPEDQGNGNTWGIVYGYGKPATNSESYTIRTEQGNYYVYNKTYISGEIDIEDNSTGILTEPEDGSYLDNTTKLTEAEIKEIVTRTYDSDLVIRATFDGGFVMQPILSNDELTGVKVTMLEVEQEWGNLKLAQAPVAVGTWTVER